jgi:protocatechuate 3,4-dioxygenase alpha subunit
MARLVLTPAQTVGPFFSIGLGALCSAGPVAPGAEGERVSVAGRVLDGDGRPVDDALLELWQADARGRYPAPQPAGAPPPAFTGFGRVATDREGAFRFTTLKPGPVPGPGGRLQAPHLAVTLFMRGLLRHLSTRLYFPDEAAANAADPVLSAVPPERRTTLVARQAASEPGVPAAAGERALRWDVRLQGPDETVFFDL